MKLSRVFAVALSLAAVQGHAADVYPSKPIRMVIPFPAGGPTDVSGRLFAEAMSAKLGQQVIVENKGGAGGTLGSAAVAVAAPDGYTILYNTSSLLLGSMLYKAVKFDPLKDFIPVARTAGTPLVVTVNPQVPARTLAEFIAEARKRPGQWNYASSGSGVIDHLGGALLTQRLEISMTHIPYKGTAPALVDLVGNSTQMMVTTLNTLLPFARDKKLVPLAIASLNRSPLLPDVPTVAEAANLPNFEMTAWTGLVVPAGTPPAIVAKLNAAVNASIAQKEFVDKLRATGAEVYGGSSEEYAAYLRSELARWKSVIQSSGVTPQ
ncbi:MAG TPA: tripartite tricarboxylate transporter substrate binding protein [Burkholderiaceae bacterium]|jgi:tripartite-type tricarboxylate transporter receptor subunit TctC|nr:tripartite tricarboxylate transporter substrate binding protein [Burkholderiaceae bacterium]